MYGGLLGRFRKNIENKTINEFISILPNGITVLDCPCGNGRWFKTISSVAKKIIALDVSVGMTNYAKNRVISSEIVVLLGDAEKIDLDDASVDYVFSYALMKHVPHHIQINILKEFNRVSKNGVICSFPIFNKLSYWYWKRSDISESYPMFQKDIEQLARHAGMKIVKQKKISQPILGLEHLLQFEPVDKEIINEFS